MFLPNFDTDSTPILLNKIKGLQAIKLLEQDNIAYRASGLTDDNIKNLGKSGGRKTLQDYLQISGFDPNEMKPKKGRLRRFAESTGLIDTPPDSSFDLESLKDGLDQATLDEINGLSESEQLELLKDFQ
jgi:hypothetical protein